MPRVFNKAVLLVFSTAVNPQELNVRIDVPFKVNKIKFQPPYSQILAADTQVESYMIQTDLVRDGGHVGVFSGTRAANSIPSNNQDALVYDFAQPQNIGGLYKFYIRSFSELGGGAAVPITGKVWMNLEFHEAV